MHIGDLEILDTTTGLLEAPLWDPATGTLYFSDAAGGGVWRYDPASGEKTCPVPHRKGVGGLTGHAAGGLVMSGKDVIWRRGEDRSVIIANDPAWGLNRFNDIGTDAAGRVYAGALDYDPAQPDRPRNPGRLFVADLDGAVREVDDGLGVPNGIGVSPTGDRLYLADTSARAIWVYDVKDHGDLGPRRTFAAFDEGEPDGLAVAADGSLWVAVRKPGSICVFSPDGQLVSRFAPHAHPTSLCFGGADLRDLYITTSDSSAGHEAVIGQLCRIRASVAGLGRAPARVPVQGWTV